MSERARIWQRVSTGAQDEASQLPSLVAWCDSHGYQYDVAEAYVVKASAYHGRQISKLEQAVSEMEAGQYQVLVFWAADRMWRSDKAQEAFALVARIVASGGRLEFVEDDDLNRNPADDAWRWYEDFSRTMGRAHKESKRKSERIRINQALKRERGSVVGRAPWGFEIKASDGIKTLVPTDEGRKYIPIIFEKVIKGSSLRDVAMFLDAEGVKTQTGGKWNEGTIGSDLVKNPTYYGNRPNSGNLVTEALVTVVKWQEAQAALARRYRPGRSTVKRERALLAPVCASCYGTVRDGCANGISPMYRVYVGNAANRTAYYRCTGDGPQRKGCGAPMAPVAWADSNTLAALSHNSNAHHESVFIAGDDHSERIASLQEQIGEAARKGDYQLVADLSAQAQSLEATPSVRPHWQQVETGQTEAEYFAGLSATDHRDYIARRYEVRLDTKLPRVNLVERKEHLA